MVHTPKQLVLTRASDGRKVTLDGTYTDMESFFDVVGKFLYHNPEANVAPFLKIAKSFLETETDEVTSEAIYVAVISGRKELAKWALDNAEEEERPSPEGLGWMVASSRGDDPAYPAHAKRHWGAAFDTDALDEAAGYHRTEVCEWLLKVERLQVTPSFYQRWFFPYYNRQMTVELHELGLPWPRNALARLDPSTDPPEGNRVHEIFLSDLEYHRRRDAVIAYMQTAAGQATDDDDRPYQFTNGRFLPCD